MNYEKQIGKTWINIISSTPLFLIDNRRFRIALRPSSWYDFDHSIRIGHIKLHLSGFKQ